MLGKPWVLQATAAAANFTAYAAVAVKLLVQRVTASGAY